MGVEDLGARVGAEERVEKLDTIEWKTPMAYAFESQRFSANEALRIISDLPSHLDEGRRLEVTFRSSSPAYLIVFGVDGTGAHSLLWPSNEEPYPLARPDAPAEFPSPRERAAGYAYRLQLPSGSAAPVRESLLVYGFREQGDFESVHPERLGGDAQYADKLAQQVVDIPPTRWARYRFYYDLLPGVTRPPLVTVEGSSR